MEGNWSIAYAEIEGLLRAGDAAAARSRLRQLARRTVPRPELPTVAHLLFRCGLYEIAMRLLVRYVRPSARSPIVATDAEKTEYAACLVRLEAVDEAIELLQSVDARRSPRAYLYLAFARAAQWSYGETIAPLKHYKASPGIGVYQRLVAKVNLAAALVFERDAVAAENLLRELLHETSMRRLPLLMANTLELSAEHFILKRKWGEAERFLGKARILLRESGSVYEFLVQKWIAVLDFMRRRTNDLDELRRLARDRSQWETIRDCDRFTVLRDRDPKLLAHLYYGTPFESYRRRLTRDLGKKTEVPAEYTWRLGPPRWTRRDPLIDLFNGQVEVAGEVRGTLKSGMLLHRLLVQLASDFYRPFRIATLHGKLNPGIHFRPTTSAARIHETVRMLRQWLEKHSVPLEIVSTDGGYRLHAAEPVALRVVAGKELGQRAAGEMESLRNRWPSQWFAIGDAVKHLELPRRSVQRLLQRALTEGGMEREGDSRYTRYRFRTAA